jgi:hypothetical protein
VLYFALPSFYRSSAQLRNAAHRILQLAFIVALSILPMRIVAQTGLATLSGTITDPSGAIITKANVTVTNEATGVAEKTETTGAGVYVVEALPPGTYRVLVEHQGFKQIEVEHLQLHTQDIISRNFVLPVGAASETIQVSGNQSTINESPAVSMTVDREFVENMPLNGRSFQDLIQLAPGTASSSNPTSGSVAGYYSIDGQYTDANNFTVDGVSANLGGWINSVSTEGGLSGTAPLQTVLGTTQSLVSVDSLQEFTIQTSGYSAEYGRNPGGQVQFTTRSGTNDIHGSLFEYLRNTAFDANSWLNDHNDDPKTAEHQNDFGGTAGGPVVIPRLYNGKDKTFYFLSYEGLRLLLPSSESEYVPTQALRTWASQYVQPALNAKPLPNPNSPGNNDGCTITSSTTGQPTACDAHFYYGYSYPEKLDNLSVRADQNFGGRFHFFIRYADTPSSEATGAEQVSTQAVNTSTLTAGLTAKLKSTLLDDLRFNYSRDNETRIVSQRSVNGSVPLRSDVVIPPTYNAAGAAGEFLVEVPGTSLFIAPYISTAGEPITYQHQFQVVNSVAWSRGKHSMKFGVDCRRLAPVVSFGAYTSELAVAGLADIQQGTATVVVIGANSLGKPVFDNLSLYAQDHWVISRTLSLDYGLRWEFNPPPGPANGLYPVALTSSDLTTATLTNDGSQPYKTNYHSFAPRFGFAWNAISSQRRALTIRGGFGIFYDTGQSVIGASYISAWPYSALSISYGIPLPVPAAVSVPPSINTPVMPPYPYLSDLADVNLTFPYTEQWNLSMDQKLGTHNTLTTSYVGNNGRKLLFTEDYTSVPGDAAFPQGLGFVNNVGQSSYNALMVQDAGRLLNGLDLVGSFTLAHALDNASNDSSLFAPEWGNSDFDLRRVLNLALNYQTPGRGRSSWAQGMTHGWLVANRFSAQSGYPINLYESEVLLPNGTESYFYPDRVPGVPIYLHGEAAYASGTPPYNIGWRLNRAAFACTATGATSGACAGTPTVQGDLGRNYVRGPSFWALNTALQRTFLVYERLNLNFRAEAFNILNHPNMLVYDDELSDPTFGEVVGGAAIGANNALYEMGATRSLQFSLKLQF